MSLLQVLRGADRNIDVVIRGPDESVIAKFDWTNEANWNKVVETDGTVHLKVTFDFT